MRVDLRAVWQAERKGRSRTTRSGRFLAAAGMPARGAILPAMKRWWRRRKRSSGDDGTVVEAFAEEVWSEPERDPDAPEFDIAVTFAANSESTSNRS